MFPVADSKNNTVAEEQKQLAWLVMETLTVLLQGSSTTNTNAGLCRQPDGRLFTRTTRFCLRPSVGDGRLTLPFGLSALFREFGGARCVHNIVKYRQCREHALLIIQQLVLSPSGDDDMGTLLGLMHSAPPSELQLKTDILRVTLLSVMLFCSFVPNIVV